MLVLRLLMFSTARLEAKPSMGAAVATVKKGRFIRKLKYRVMSLMAPVPTATHRSQSSGRLMRSSPTVASSKAVWVRTWILALTPAEARISMQRLPAIS